MSARILYGVPTSSLEDVLNHFMVQQGNDRRSHFADYLITASQVWEQLFRDTVWSVRQVVIDVDKSKRTIRLPEGMERLLSISVVDNCNNLQPIAYDPNMNTLQVRCHTKQCSCTTCNGDGTLCDAIDSITMREFSVVINTLTYYGRVWNVREGCDIKEITETPTLDGDDIVMTKQIKLICTVDLDEKGCIKSTQPNSDLIFKHCGCYITDCQRAMCDRDCVTLLPADYSRYGYWKEDANCDGLVHLKDTRVEKVIVAYQPASSSVHGGRVMVPDYAKDAVMYGLHYYTVRFRMNIGRGDKLEAERGWLQAKRKLFTFMYPISLDEFSKLPQRKIIW